MNQHVFGFNHRGIHNNVHVILTIINKSAHVAFHIINKSTSVGQP